MGQRHTRALTDVWQHAQRGSVDELRHTLQTLRRFPAVDVTRLWQATRAAAFVAAVNDHASALCVLLGPDSAITADGGVVCGFVLKAASNAGAANSVRVLLEAKACVETTNASLYIAANRGHLQTCAALLAGKANVRALGPENRSALFAASKHGHAAVAELLLCHRACASATSLDGHGVAPLHEAAYRGHVEVVRLLVRHGASVHQTNLHGRVAAHDAASVHRLDILEVLAEAKASMYAQDAHGCTPLHCVLERTHATVNEPVDMVRGLLHLQHLDHHLDQHLDQHLDPHLDEGAQEEEDWAAVRALDLRDRRSIAPLHIAAGRGMCAVVELLARAKADVNVTTWWNGTPLMHLAKRGSMADVTAMAATAPDAAAFVPVRALLARTKAPLARTKADANASNYCTVAELLARAKADVDASDCCTVAELLARVNADVHVPRLISLAENSAGMAGSTNVAGSADVAGSPSAAAFARAARVLLDCKADVNASDDFGTTPLSEAITSGASGIGQVAQCLIAAKAHTTTKVVRALARCVFEKRTALSPSLLGTLPPNMW